MRRAMVVVALASLLVVPSAGAQPRTPRSPGSKRLDEVKRYCEGAIDRRLTRLGVLSNSVSTAAHLTAEHQTTLSTQINSARAALSALRSKIASDSDGATLRSDCEQIRDGYRVYVLVSPKVREVVAADVESAVGARLQGIAAKIQDHIDTAEKEGKDVSAAQDSVDEMLTDAGKAHDLAGAVPPRIIDLAVSNWPSAHDTLVEARTDLTKARSQLREARDEGRDAVQNLRNHG